MKFWTLEQVFSKSQAFVDEKLRFVETMEKQAKNKIPLYCKTTKKYYESEENLSIIDNYQCIVC